MAWAPVALVVLYLAAIDIAINVVFAYPPDPLDTAPSRLRQYFEYGRSIEGKLTRMTQQTDEASAPIVAKGWLGSDPGWRSFQPDPSDTRPLVTVYGMSHADLLGKDMAALDGGLRVRTRAAPQAVPTWSYSAFLADQEVRSDVAILGIMTSTVSLSATASGATMYFDGAYPYTYPRYHVENGALRAVEPPFTTVERYRRSFFDRVLWEEYLAWLERNDRFYDPFLFRASVLDRSSIFRLLRRSYATATRAARQATVYDDQRGFHEASEEVVVLKALVVDFARRARQNKTVPVVYVINTLRTGDRLYRLLEPTLREHAIPHLSSHLICPPNDPQFYLPDSHFVESKNRELAQAMNDLVRRELASAR